ncbi:MAG: B12-binding domain-containing radical SAM protein [Deltaproteobacteria bacterium]|nr:B12-binding domain-containing radical SAM protein [Deltaproteobacteria bacterium]MBN2671913.1 B12-binding domain-containing radical SAM protein [Deltaproteobacteria bacterium]
MSRFALVNFVPPKDVANYLGYSQGLGSISAVLKQLNHQTVLFNIDQRSDTKSFEAAAYCDAVMVYLTTTGYPLFRYAMAQYWGGNLPVFVGGPHAIALPEVLAMEPHVTGVCAGEGELTAQVLSRWMHNDAALSDVPNLFYNDNGVLQTNATGCYVADLDSLPFPDRDFFPYADVLSTKAGRLVGMEFMATRGCKYGCRFCLNPRLLKLQGKQMIRRRSVSSIIEEVRIATNKYRYNGVIGFHDDIFTLDVAWLNEFANRFKKEINRPFWCNVHIDDIDEQIVRTLRRAGCYRVLVGIECGNETMRKKALGKHLGNDEILYKISLLKQQHIKIVATFMIGLPGETESNLRESVDFCRAIAPDWILLSSLFPFPGTRLYTQLVAEGRLKADFYQHMNSETFYSASLVYDQGILSMETLQYYFKNFRKMAGVL